MLSVAARFRHERLMMMNVMVVEGKGLSRVDHRVTFDDVKQGHPRRWHTFTRKRSIHHGADAKVSSGRDGSTAVHFAPSFCPVHCSPSICLCEFLLFPFGVGSESSFFFAKQRQQRLTHPFHQKHNIDSAGSSLMVAAHSAPAILRAGKPYLVYGTAWKEGRTASLVADAVRAGFRFIDTACQPKHYNEAGVGDGWTTAARELNLQRSDLFLQTKFTPYPGQDPKRLPYNPHDSLEKQVQTSLEVSLENLQTTYLDSLVLHSPLSSMDDTLTVWRTMESFVDDGKVRQLGISNCYDFDFFQSLYEQARIKPKVLQNR